MQNDALDKHFAGCEAADKCCIFIPLRPGVIIIAILQILSGAGYILDTLDPFYSDPLWKIVSAVTLVPAVVGDYFFLLWLISVVRDTETGVGKNTLARGVMLNMLSVIAHSLLAVVIAILTLSGAIEPII